MALSLLKEHYKFLKALKTRASGKSKKVPFVILTNDVGAVASVYLRDNPDFMRVFDLFLLDPHEYKEISPELLELLREYSEGSNDTTLPLFYGLVYSFGVILPPEVVKTGFLLNVHYSALPMWRGCCPVIAAILTGEGLGITVHRVAEKVDTGDILLQKNVPQHYIVEEKMTPKNILLFEYQNAEQSFNILTGVFVDTMLPKVAQAFIKLVQGRPVLFQEQRGATTYVTKAILKQELQLRFTQETAVQIARKVAAFNPKSKVRAVAYAQDGRAVNIALRNVQEAALVAERTKLMPRQLVKQLIRLKPGQPLFVKKDGLYVGTLTGPVRIEKGAIEGKKALRGEQWLSLKGRLVFFE